ncbi:MAG: hypothetical protein SFY81_10235 [Verrucomicrobiota bacterium]|nr:hypothetical protein [Verrucomicrobiota bacterium]
MSAARFERRALADFPGGDLRMRFGPDGLLNIVLDVIGSVVWPKSDRQEFQVRENVLRTVVLYGYAAGIFSSRDLELECRSEKSLQYISKCGVPSWHDIRQFRRRESPFLKRALIEVLKKASESVNYWEMAMERFESSALKMEREADRRFSLAIKADSAALDD